MNMKKQSSSEKQSEVSKQPQFTKAQIASSNKYGHLRDIVDAVLEDNRKYTLEEVDNTINLFMKGEVE